MATTTAVFKTLAGRWGFDRLIEPGIGTVTGTASFREVATDRLRYREDGRLSLTTGYTGAVFREYVYVLEGERILVCFADGDRPSGLLHTLRLADSPTGGSVLCATDAHHCGQDRYEGTYRFEDPGRFTVAIRVTGPSKDYRLTTEYRRLVRLGEPTGGAVADPRYEATTWYALVMV